MGCKASKTERGGLRAALLAACAAILLALTLLLAAPAAAHENHEDHEETTMQAAEETTATAENAEPAGKDREPTTTAVQSEESVAKAQNTGDESGQEAQGSGQRTPADATEDDGRQTAARAVGPLANATARLTDDDENDGVEQVTIEADDCNPPRAADSSVTIRIGGLPRVINDTQNNFTFGDEQIVIEPVDGVENIEDQDEDPLDTEAGIGKVIDSSGIVCSRADDGEDSDNGNSANGDDNGDLDCDALLRRFREADGDQYVAVDVRSQILVCLEQEVDQDTAADEDLPDTGGPSLIGLVVLGVVSALAGFSLVRGSWRKD